MLNACAELLAAAFYADRMKIADIGYFSESKGLFELVEKLSGHCEYLDDKNSEGLGRIMVRPIRCSPVGISIEISECTKKLFSMIAGLAVVIGMTVKVNKTDEEVSNQELDFLEEISGHTITTAKNADCLIISGFGNEEEYNFRNCTNRAFCSGVLLALGLTGYDTLVYLPEIIDFGILDVTMKELAKYGIKSVCVGDGYMIRAALTD